MSDQLTLVYWDMRGLVEPIKTLLEYLEVPYKHERIKDLEAWETHKAQLAFPFPNLPYLKDRSTCLTESDAIMSYICLKYKKPELTGKNEDRVEFIQINNAITDLQGKISNIIYGCKDHDDLKRSITAYFEKDGSFKVKSLERILEGKKWVLGYMTYIDFHLAELVERYSDLDREVGTLTVSKCDNLQSFLKNFLEVPQIKQYRQSERFQSRPYYDYDGIWK